MYKCFGQLYARERDPTPSVQEAGWAPGPVRTGAENLTPYWGVRSPDRPALTESLYRQRCPGPPQTECKDVNYYLKK
jgi:hypothetical protein